MTTHSTRKLAQGKLAPPGLAVLRPGLDRLPSRCARCGSGLMSAEPPLGRALFGQLSCIACGQVLAYLRPGFPTRDGRPLSSVPSRHVPSVAAPVRSPSPVASSRATPEPWRLLGCGDACNQCSHDPYAHEAHGRRQAETAERARQHGTLSVGPLAIDFDLIRVTVDGSVIDVTPTEYLIITRLARSVGTAVTVAELTDSVWGTDHTVCERTTAGALLPPSAHLLRVNIARLRRRLGAGGHLIETIPWFGYALVDER